MLAKSNRLPLRSLPDFFQKSYKWFSPYFTVFWRFEDASFRGTVTVGVKYSLKATDRNSIKRRFHNILINEISNLDKVSMVIAVKKEAKSKTFTELHTELKRFILFVNSRKRS